MHLVPAMQAYETSRAYIRTSCAIADSTGLIAIRKARPEHGRRVRTPSADPLEHSTRGGRRDHAEAASRHVSRAPQERQPDWQPAATDGAAARVASIYGGASKGSEVRMSQGRHDDDHRHRTGLDGRGGSMPPGGGPSVIAKGQQCDRAPHRSATTIAIPESEIEEEWSERANRPDI